MRTLLRRYTAIFVSFLVFASVLVGFTQTNNVLAAPEFYGGEASCKKGDLQFQQISNFKTDPTTAPDGYSGLAFAALWSSSPAEYGRFIEGKQLAAYSSSYYLQGYCSGALSTGQFSNIGFILFPKTSDVRVWEGFSATFTNGISTEIAAIRFTFTQDFSSYTVATLEESSTKLLSNGELPLNNLNSALDGWSYSTQSSLRPSNAPTNEISNQYVLDTIKAGIADNGGSPSIPPPVSDCTPLPLCKAEVSAVYEDAAHINISSIKFNDPVYEDIGANLLFFDNDLGNADTDGSDDLVYKLQNEVCSNGEYNRIDFDGQSTSLGALGVNPRAVLRISFKTASGECTQQEASIAISNPVYALAEDGNPRSSVRASQIMYRLTSASVIRRVDAESDKEFTFELNTAFTIDGTAPELAYVRTDNIVARSGACSNFISRDSSNIKKITFVHDRGVGSCGVGTQTTGFLLVKADGSPVDPVLPVTEEDQVAGDSEDTCDSGVGSFGWLVCPALEGIDSFINWAEDKIENQLTVDLGTKETRESLQDAWQIVARLASGVLVAIALVMVIATALGSDLVSPYALKKVLPRLVIGAIGIWLSWALVTTYIDIMNDFGKGISGILLTPFEGARDINLVGILTNLGINSGSEGTSSTIFVGLATAGLISAGIFGILSAAVTALFAFLVAIIVLALRQAVIIFLVVLAPLGFAMWILPNTQKVWKLWSGTLNKLLLMYPMLMGILAAGKIFAYITSTSADNSGGTVDEFFKFTISLIAYVAPYFFLPALFKAAGGIFSNLTGMVNDKGKGIFDRFKGGLDERAKSRKAFKNQMSSEKQARRGAGQGFLSSISRANMRAKGGQPITGGVLTLRNRAAATQRVQSSMAAAQEKLEEQQIQEETTKMLQSGTLNNRDVLRNLAVNGSVVQRRAAINRLMQISDDEGMRSIKSASMASSDNRVREMWNKVQSSKELNDAFKDNAPDIMRGEDAFSNGFNTSMLTKASKNTYAQATTQYKEAQRLLSGLSSGAIAPSSISSEQSGLLGAYVDKTDDGKLILNATSLTNGVNKLQNAIKVTAASAKEATLNPALRAEFKTVQATEALKMLNDLDTTFVGIASPDIAAVGSRIDPTTGLR